MTVNDIYTTLTMVIEGLYIIPRYRKINIYIVDSN